MLDIYLIGHIKTLYMSKSNTGYGAMPWFNTRSIKWKLYACNESIGYKFKEIFTTKSNYMERKGSNYFSYN